MAGIRFAIGSYGTSHRIKSPNEFWIPLKSLGRRHVFEAMSFPQAVLAAKCRNSALGTDSSSGQNE